MKLISVILPPSKSVFYELQNLFFERYTILYLTQLIRENSNNDSPIWTSIMQDINSGNRIKNHDISEVICDYISKDDKDYILLTAFPRTSEQINYLRDVLKAKKLNYELIGIFKKFNNYEVMKKTFKDWDKVIEVSELNELIDKL